MDNKTKQTKRNVVPFKKLFRFTNGSDILLMILMICSSAAVGLATPMNILVLKDIVDILVNPVRPSSFYVALMPMVIRFSIVASATFICGFVQMICVTITSEHQGRQYKHHYFSALVHQEISWFDGQRTEDLFRKINNDIETIQVIIVDKLSLFVQQLACFIGSLVIAFVSGWDLALAACTVIILMTITFSCMICMVKKYSLKQTQAYVIAGEIAHDIISGIRVVMEFNAQEKELKRYSDNLRQSEVFGVKRSIFQGLGAGMIGLSTFAVASLVFYLGGAMVQEAKYEGGVVVLTFLSVVLGSIVLGNAALLIDTFSVAQTIAYPIFQVIDKKAINDTKNEGILPDNFDGDIVFKNVRFVYPNQPRVMILDDFNLTIPKGKRIALIGPRGSGKSAVIHLLQRLYTPTSGMISLNDTDLNDINLKWYRSYISVLEKIPTMFSGTIAENIHLGDQRTNHFDVKQAANDANAISFIKRLSKKFDTDVDDFEARLNVSQKQLISVATALIRKPQLLLIDKALAALDIMSEREVEESVFKMISSLKGTVIFAAHYLKYVRNAKIIVVMKGGKIVEQGNHDELIEKMGLYYTMCEIQKSRSLEREISILPQVIRKYDMETRKISINVTDGKTQNTRILAPFRRKSEFLKKRLSLTKSIDIADILQSRKENTPVTVNFQSTRDFLRIMRWHKSNIGLLGIALIASVFVGVSFPAAAAIYAEMFKMLSAKLNKDVLFKKRSEYCGLMLLPAFTLFVAQLIKAVCLGIAGEALTTRIRKKLFAAILKQDMSWFEKPENALSNLTSLLSTEASLIKGMACVHLSVYVEVIATIVTFFVMGFIFSWMLTLLSIIFIPFIILAGIMQGKLSSSQRITWMDSKQSNALLLEALNKIKKIQFLNLQSHFCDRYLDILKWNGRNKKWKLFFYGILNAMCASAMSFAFCLIFYTGTVIIDRGYIEVIDLTRVFAIISISSVTLGRTLSLTPDLERARRAARRVLTTFDQQSSIKYNNTKVLNTKLEGNIEFKHICFRYENRLNIPVLRRFTLKINAGETVALVGHSNCGKSTITWLLKRLYDPLHNPILLDGIDLSSMNVRSIRDQIALVTRHSHLFEISIQENIAYGSEKEPESKLVEEAARKANIHDFIVNLPEGYSTKIGKNGYYLNSSQKQRVCIARAFYCHPQIWILDEALADIDTENYSVVSRALKTEMDGCTCIIIPHQYSEIQNVDKIVVLENGIVEEIGTHDELFAKKGRYYVLNIQHIH